MATVKIRQARQLQAPGASSPVIQERVIEFDPMFPMPGFSFVCADQSIAPFAWRDVDPEVVIAPKEGE